MNYPFMNRSDPDLQNQRPLAQQGNIPVSYVEVKENDQGKGRDGIQWLRILLTVFFGILALVIVLEIITEGSILIARLLEYIMSLFRGPRIYPSPNSKFIQLVLIAIFVGWAIRRFRKR
jgi:hypothetical protein